MTSGMAFRMARFLASLARSASSERRRSISTDVRAANNPSVCSAIFAIHQRLPAHDGHHAQPPARRIREGHSEITQEAHLHEKLVQGKMRLHVTVVEEAAAFEHLLTRRVVYLVFEIFQVPASSRHGDCPDAAAIIRQFADRHIVHLQDGAEVFGQRAKKHLTGCVKHVRRRSQRLTDSFQPVLFDQDVVSLVFVSSNPTPCGSGFELLVLV